MENNQQNFRLPQQLPINNEQLKNKLNYKIITLAILIIVVAVAGSVILSRGKTNISPITNQSSENQTQTISNNEMTQKVVGPLTIQPLMPIVEADEPSTLYQNSIIPVQLSDPSTETQTQLNDDIKKSDTEIKSRSVENPDNLFRILYEDKAKQIILYVMTPTGTFCGESEMGFHCDKAKLKILNIQDNSVTVLVENFSGQIYLNQKDKTIIVFSGSSYKIFNQTKPYLLLKSTATGFISLLFNEFAVSYNSTTSSLVIENILNNKKIDCSISNVSVKNNLKNNFDFSHFSISPNGDKIILFEGNEKFFWSDISNQWISDSSGCLNAAKEAKLAGLQSVSRIGKWYANSSFFAYSGYGDNSFIYDFNAQKQIFFMPWDNTVGIGYLNNFGYHDSANIDEGISKAIIVPGEKQISVYFDMTDGKRYLIGTYSDKFSTQTFHELTKQYPINSVGVFTSGKLIHVGVPKTWVRIEKDTANKNLYRLLILDGYNVRQALEVSVQP